MANVEDHLKRDICKLNETAEQHNTNISIYKPKVLAFQRKGK
jgi:hypothetical protein